MKSTFLILFTLFGSWFIVPTVVLAQAESATQSIAATYNEGVALYRDGKFAEAATMFQRAASAADSSLAAKARYNLGNTHYARALAILQPPSQSGASNPPASSDDLFGPPPAYTQPQAQEAIGHLESAIGQYRSSLRIIPGDSDARANIELASMLLDQLKQQQKQQEQERQKQQQQDQQQSQEQEQQDQQPQQQQDEKQQEQEQQDQQQQQSESDPSQKSSQANPEPGESDPQQSEQPESSQQSEEEQPQPDDASRAPNENQQDFEQQDSAQQPTEEPTREQDPSPDNQPENEPENAEDEPTPSGELTAANESDGDLQESMVDPAKTMQMTEQEARKMLQAIRDRDMLRRLRRQAAERWRRVPVDRDW